MKLKLKIGAMLLLGAVTWIVGCSMSSSGGSSSGGVSISGSLASTPLLIAKVEAMSGKNVATMSDNGTMSIDLSALEVYIIYFSGTEIGTTTATIDGTTGAWSFVVPAGSQITAIVRNKTSEEVVGPITFVDSTSKDMSGNDKEMVTFSFKSGATLGSIELSDDGKFQVDATIPAVAAAANTVNSAPASVVDFTGDWKLKAYTGTLPEGYGTACQVGDMACHGPQVDEPIYMAKLEGKKFTYSGGNCATLATTGSGTCGTSDGTVGTEDVHAAQIWAGGVKIQDCGFKTGFLADEARAHGRISIPSGGLPLISGAGVSSPTSMSFGRVVFSVPTSYGTNGGDMSPNDEPWMKGAATTAYDIMECKNVEKTGTDAKKYNLNVCKGTLNTMATGYSAMGPGGCVDSANKPVVIKDWTSLNGVTPSCTQAAHPALANMQVQTCSYTGVSLSVASATSFTCKNVYGTFTDSSATTPAVSAWITTFTKVSAGALCSGISDQLQRYKCYANAYFNDSSRAQTGCSREFRFNWQAANANEFVSEDGSRDKPKGQHLTSIVTYSPDGQSFTLEDENGQSISVQNGTGSVVCRVSEKMVLKATKLGSNKLLMDLTQSAILKDATVPACVGEKNNSTANSGHGSELYNRLREGNQKFLFTLER